MRVVRRALALQHLARGLGAAAAARAVGLNAQTVRTVARRYQREGLNAAIYEAPRPGAEEVLTPAAKQRIIAMVCTQPPAGATRWTLALITEEAVKRKLAPPVGRETIRVLLHGHDLKPWREKKMVHQ